MRLALVLMVVVGTVAAAQAPVPPPPAQDAPLTFDVASVKPNTAKDGRMAYRSTPQGAFSATNMNLGMLITQAYGIRREQLKGGPGWVRTQGFDIEARPEREVPRAQALEMLRNLLEDRFKLVLRKEAGELPAFTLTLARDDGRLGPGLRRSEAECVKSAGPTPAVDRRLRPGQPAACGMGGSNGTFSGGGVPMNMLIAALRMSVSAPITDRTGLTGNFDFYFTAPRADPSLSSAVAPGALNDVSIFTVVQEQLGLKLESERVLSDVYVIEGIEQPTPN